MRNGSIHFATSSIYFFEFYALEGVSSGTIWIFHSSKIWYVMTISGLRLMERGYLTSVNYLLCDQSRFHMILNATTYPASLPQTRRLSELGRFSPPGSCSDFGSMLDQVKSSWTNVSIFQCVCPLLLLIQSTNPDDMSVMAYILPVGNAVSNLFPGFLLCLRLICCYTKGDLYATTYTNSNSIIYILWNWHQQL